MNGADKLGVCMSTTNALWNGAGRTVDAPVWKVQSGQVGTYLWSYGPMLYARRKLIHIGR